MYEKSFKLEIITPARIVYEGDATSLSAPGSVGAFQVLYNHAPLLSALDIGKLKVKDIHGADTLYASAGGVVEVRKNVVTVLVESAERADQIDVERAKAARDRAAGRLHSDDESIDMQRANLALWRAINRLRVAGGH